jgi:hypothetical protein
MTTLSNTTPFILLTILFGLQAQNVFLINRLLDFIRDNCSEKDNNKEKKKKKAKSIIKCLNFIIFACFIGIFLLLVKIAISLPDQEGQIIKCLDCLIVSDFFVITITMSVTFLISTFQSTTSA